MTQFIDGFMSTFSSHNLPSTFDMGRNCAEFLIFLFVFSLAVAALSIAIRIDRNERRSI